MFDDISILDNTSIEAVVNLKRGAQLTAKCRQRCGVTKIEEGQPKFA